MAGKTELKRIAVVRVRGTVRAPENIKTAFQNIGLTRVNHCVIVDNSPMVYGTVKLLKDYITWGTLDKTARAMIESKGRLLGDHKVTEAVVKASGFSSLDDFVKKFMAFEAETSMIKGMKKVFRLHPPRKGYETIKQSYPRGALGNRDGEIGELLKRMI